jgi:hypothetical protein
MKVYRAFYNKAGIQSPLEKGGPLYIAREYQGGGRHDLANEGIFYCSLETVSAVAERIKPFRNMKINNDDLIMKDGSKLALASYELKGANLVDFRDARELIKMKIAPADIGTQDREVSQKLSAAVHQSEADGFIWWSTINAKWSNLSLFDSKTKNKLSLTGKIIELNIANDLVIEAAKILNIGLSN